MPPAPLVNDAARMVTPNQRAVNSATEEQLNAVLEIMPQLPIGKFSVNGLSVVFPAQKITWTGGNRLVERERAYRDGAKLDDTGSKAERWVVETTFENSINEQGLDANGIPLYPAAANALIALFRLHATGDLQLPSVGQVRARCLDFERVDTFELRDTATMHFTFIEDNEDTIGLRSLQAPSPRANGRRLALSAEFDAQSANVWDLNVRTLNTLVSQLETTLNRPHEVIQDTELASTQIRHAAERVDQAFRKAGNPGRYGLGTPRGHHMQRKMVDQQDMAGRAQLGSGGGQPTLVVIVVTIDSSLFRIAATLGQSLDALLRVNPQLQDPCSIPRGTRVRVFSNAA